MKNVEEHKKLLAQIAELEKDSTNFFDVEKEFFLIDSENLSEVKTKLYGYSIQATGIYEQDNLTEDAAKNLDGRGCYVYVEVKDGQITIKQDLNGCWGIYLFRHGDYFALSNSFFRLLDHVKFKYPLTVNRDYCNYFLVIDLCSHAYSETAVNEISLVDRSAILQIDKAEKHLEIELIDYREHTVSLDSAEGIAIFDRWVDFWSNVLREISKRTNFIQSDLSGGFDTRISLVFLLHSGINLNTIRIYSSNDGLHTHKEDYEIASGIADHYGFKLNQPLPEQKKLLRYSLSNVVSMDCYHRQTFHKDYSYWAQKSIEKTYRLNGSGGETIRKYWHGSPKNFIKNQSRRANYYPCELASEISYSIENIVESAFRKVCNKFKINNEDSELIPQYLYQETRCRHHFGKANSNDYLRNTLNLSPTLDPEIRQLCLNSLNCSDYNLLMALLFVRYAPDLLKFPFEGNRSIAPETIAYAQKLNEHFPRYFLSANDNRGGYRSICNLVTCKQKKFLIRGATINLFQEEFPELT